MDRLFLDANVLFSAAYRADNGLLRLWKLPDTTLVSSRYALEEARVNLDREDQRNALAQLANDLELFEAPQKGLRPAIRLPEKDIPIILAAIEAPLSSDRFLPTNYFSVDCGRSRYKEFFRESLSRVF